MDTMLIQERYKVIRVLWSQQDYALAEAVDIQERETPSCLINLYEGELLHRYGKICADLRKEDCPEFREAFLVDGTLAVVFNTTKGESIDAAFFRGDSWTWQQRLDYAELVLHQALMLANLPPEISCAVMLSDNLFVDTDKQRVSLQYMLRPLEAGYPPRELALLACDQAGKILRWTNAAGPVETAFVDRLELRDFPSIVPMYSAWRQADEAIRAEREAFNKLGLVRRILTRVWRQIKRLWRRRKHL